MRTVIDNFFVIQTKIALDQRTISRKLSCPAARHLDKANIRVKVLQRCGSCGISNRISISMRFLDFDVTGKARSSSVRRANRQVSY